MMKNFLQQLDRDLSKLHKLKPKWCPQFLATAFGLLLVAIGIGALAMYGGVQIITCAPAAEGNGVTCTREIKMWGLVPLKRQTIANVTEATLGFSCHSSRSRSRYCNDIIILHPAAGEPVRLPPGYYQETKLALAELREYIENPGPEPLIQRDSIAAMSWIGSVCVPPPFLIWGLIFLIYVREERAEWR